MVSMVQQQAEVGSRRYHQSKPVDYHDRIHQLHGFDDMMKDGGLIGSILSGLEPAQIIKARRVNKDMRDFIDKDIYIQQALFLVANKETSKIKDKPRQNHPLLEERWDGSRTHLKANLNPRQPLPCTDFRPRMYLTPNPAKRLRPWLAFSRSLPRKPQFGLQRTYTKRIMSVQDGVRYCDLADEVLALLNGELKGGRC